MATVISVSDFCFSGRDIANKKNKVCEHVHDQKSGHDEHKRHHVILSILSPVFEKVCELGGGKDKPKEQIALQAEIVSFFPVVGVPPVVIIT